MPALKCPNCQTSDLHAVQVDLESTQDVNHSQRHVEELACKQCGWTPSGQAKDAVLLGSRPIDQNI